MSKDLTPIEELIIQIEHLCNNAIGTVQHQPTKAVLQMARQLNKEFSENYVTKEQHKEDIVMAYYDARKIARNNLGETKEDSKYFAEQYYSQNFEEWKR